jgi:hypothetical protein
MIFYLLNLYTSGLSAVVGINGAPIFVEPAGMALGGGAEINAWLKPEGNVLSISLSATPILPSPILPPPKPLPINFKAEVYSVLPGSQTNQPDQMLATFERRLGDLPPLPLKRQIPFKVPAVPPTHLWADAAPITQLTAADQTQLRSLVQKLADAIRSRDISAISALLDYKTRDYARAGGHSAESAEQVLRQQYSQTMFSQRPLTITSPSPYALRFDLIAGGQVVWMYHSLTEPALVVESPATRFTLPIYAAKVGGAWRIVR